MKKILIFSLQYYPLIGGAEVAIKEITDRISPEELEFHMITLRNDASLPKLEKIGNVLVHRIGLATAHSSITDLQKFPLSINKFYFQIAAYIKACELQKKNKYDGTWAMMAHSCAIPAGLFKKKFPTVPYVLTLQEGDPPEYIEKLMKPVWKLFEQGFTQADALQSISTFLQAWGIRMGFKGTAKVIPNGVNIIDFARDYTAEEIAAMKKKLGKKDGEIYLVTTSRLVYKNAADDVIRALPLLPDHMLFLIYGIGPDESMLRALAKELGAEHRVRFMGQIGHAEMPLMLKACDIFIRPSRSEGMGNSFIEAMAAGIPVVATQEGGIADFLVDEKRRAEMSRISTGWAVDADSPDQIARTVQEIIASPEKVTEVTKNASHMVAEKYDWNTVAHDMEKLFTDLVQSNI